MQVEKISSSVLYFIILLLGIFVAQLVWQTIELNSSTPKHIPTSKLNSQPAHSTTSSNNHLNSVIGAQIFGGNTNSQNIVKTRPKSNNPVKKTTLNLRLTGLIKGQHSVAVIIYKGQQRPYLPGEFIVNSSRLKVQLDQIEHNYVTIINNGVHERLNLPALSNKSSMSSGISSAPQKTPVVAKLQLDLNSASLRAIVGDNPRKIITTDPLSLSKFIQISPSINKGKLNGYKISSGPDKRLLKSAGLQPGDIVTHIDGKAVAGLTIPSMYSQLQTKSRFKVTLNRQGSVLTMDIKL